MKLNKELKYNLLIAITLIVMDLLFNKVAQTRYAKDQFTYPTFILEFTSNFCFYGIYAINYLAFAPYFLAKKKLFWYGISFLGMILLFAGTRYLLEEIIFFNITGLHNYNMENPNLVSTYFIDSFYYTFRFCLYSSVVYLLFRYIENKEQMHKLNVEHQQALLATLKSQISPHFLFNTLNNFYVELYDEKPETADAILKLSQLLRYVTYETSQNFVLLKKEINFIKDYLYFFKRRYENQFYVHLNINGIVATQQIPSLILIHFIENVCKHGIINNKNYSAKINITVKENELEIYTENNINTAEKYMKAGIGSENIHKRLDVLFKNSYILNYEKEETLFKAYLKIPL